VHIGQQGQVLAGAAVPFDMFDPSPGQWDSPLPVCLADNQQLMPKANLGSIYLQMDFAQMLDLGFQPLPSDRCIPVSYSNRRIVQQSAQASGDTQQYCLARDLTRNSAEIYRTALINTNYQPDKVAYLGNALAGAQFLNPANLCIIELVDRHQTSPEVLFCRGKTLLRFVLPINCFVIKVSGG